MNIKDAIKLPEVDAIVETESSAYAVGPTSEYKSLMDVPEDERWLAIHTRHSNTQLGAATALASPEAKLEDIAQLLNISLTGISRALRDKMVDCPCCGSRVRPTQIDKRYAKA